MRLNAFAAFLGAVLSCSFVQAGVFGMLSANEYNIVIAKGYTVENEPVLELAQMYNEGQCRPSFAMGGVFAEAPVVTESNGVTVIHMTLMTGEVCGTEAKLQKQGAEGHAYSSHHLLKKLVKSGAAHSQQIASLLEMNPTILETGKIEIRFMLQYFGPRKQDSDLTFFTVPLYALDKNARLLYVSPLESSFIDPKK